MVVGDVCADQKNDIGNREVFVRSGRAVTTKPALVTGDGAGKR
jgi:hypothetical protein